MYTKTKHAKYTTEYPNTSQYAFTYPYMTQQDPFELICAAYLECIVPYNCVRCPTSHDMCHMLHIKEQ